MKPPVLNRKLTLEDPQRVADGAGGYAITWVALGTLWAQITPRTGRATGVESATVAEMPYKIFVRAAAAGAPSRPRPDQRFRAGSRIFRIEAVTEADPAAQFLVCFAREEVIQ